LKIKVCEYEENTDHLPEEHSKEFLPNAKALGGTAEAESEIKKEKTNQPLKNLVTPSNEP
jgi:hypothetical protein